MSRPSANSLPAPLLSSLGSIVVPGAHLTVKNPNLLQVFSLFNTGVLFYEMAQEKCACRVGWTEKIRVTTAVTWIRAGEVG